jgi:predicted amidohydrolase YtcJ
MADFERWTGMLEPRKGDDMLRHNGAGEMLVFSAADYEDFREPRPELPPSMEGDLENVVRLLAGKRWPFRIHATYDESITRVLDVYEKVDREVPFDGLHWIVDHAETIGDRNIDRIKALGGGIAVQHRMAYQGEYFVERYGAQAAQRTPPVRRMLDAGVPVGMGTDATRVASYNPWISLYWLTTGKTIGGMQIHGEENRLEREEALRLWTHGSAWFSNSEDDKGQLRVGRFADFAVLSADYFSVPDESVKEITSVLTVVGGKVVHGDSEFTTLAPQLPSPMPDWSPVRYYGGYQGATLAQARAAFAAAHGHAHAHHGRCDVHGHHHAAHHDVPTSEFQGFWGALGCSCFAF